MKEKLLHHPEISEEQIIVRLEQLFMCEVSQRYALCYQAGIQHNLLSSLTGMSSPPKTAVGTLLYNLQKVGIDKSVFKNLTDIALNTPLPEGFPDFLNPEENQ